MTSEQKTQIIQLCKQHIKQHGNVRVGWACEQLYPKQITGPDRDKISALLYETGKYERHENQKYSQDWDITKNPNYKWKFWKRELVYDFVLALTSATLTLIILQIEHTLDKQSLEVKYERLNEQVNHQKHTIQQILQKISYIKPTPDSTLQKGQK